MSPAAIITCIAIGLLSALEVYAAQLIWPVAEQFPDLDTAFTSVAGRAFAPLGLMVAGTVIVACAAGGMAMQTSAARLLYGMGRAGALPTAFFGALDPKRSIPRNNVILVGAVALVGALVLPQIAGESTGFDLGASLLNFGALLGFMGVNAAAFMHFYWRSDRKSVVEFVAPAIGFVVCLLLWWNVSGQSRILGTVWIGIGIVFGAWKTKGFRTTTDMFQVPPEPLAAASHQSLMDSGRGTAR